MNRIASFYFFLFLSTIFFSCNKKPFVDFKLKVVDSTVTVIPFHENAENIHWEVEGFKTISTLDTFSFVIPIQKVGQLLDSTIRSVRYQNGGVECNRWYKLIAIKATKTMAFWHAILSEHGNASLNGYHESNPLSTICIQTSSPPFWGNCFCYLCTTKSKITPAGCPASNAIACLHLWTSSKPFKTSPDCSL